MRSVAPRRPAVAAPPPPGRLAYLGLGLGGALCGGSVVGAAEGLYLLGSTRPAEYQAFVYGAALYGLAGLVVGVPVGVGLAVAGRWAGIAAPRAWSASFAAAGAALGTFVLAGRAGAFVAEAPARPSVVYAVVTGALALAVAWFGGHLLAKTPLRVLAGARGTLGLWGGGMLIAAMLSASPAPGAATEWAPDRPQAASFAEKPDLVLVVIDGLRADALDPARMPALAGLAADGVTFTEAVAPAGAVAPAIASILTATPPSVHGLFADGDLLGPTPPTLAEVLRDGGYATGGVPATVSAAGARGLDRGFDGYALVRRDPLGARDSATALELYGRVRAHWERLTRRPPPDAWHAPAGPQLERARAFLAENAGRRGFVFVQLSEPDLPWFDGPDVVGTAYRAPADAAEARALQDRELAAVDAALGAFLAGLRDADRYDDAVIAVTGSRGLELGERGVYGPGEDLHDAVVRVPLVVKLPRGERAGTVVPWQVRTFDLAPTLVELAGFPAPPGWQGAPLFDDWFDDDLARAWPGAAEDGTPLPAPGWPDHPGSRPALAEQRVAGGQLVVVREGGRKLARLRGGVVPVSACFDLVADPEELRPLPSDDVRCRRADVAEALLGGWTGVRPPPTPREDPEVALPEEE